MTHANVSVKIMLRTKKIMVGILGHVFARIYLRFENSVWWNYMSWILYQQMSRIYYAMPQIIRKYQSWFLWFFTYRKNTDFA